jgi:membrane protease YdiL (CAAX protease family)
LICSFFLIATRIFVLKTVMPWSSLPGVLGAAIAVPLIEELFFRGLLLGILLRDLRPTVATLLISAFFAVIHFLKAPARPYEVVSWFSGFRSIGNSFGQFADPMMVLALFATLFLIGWILADARLRTRSLFLPIGLHSGWILMAGAVGKLTRRSTIMLPWLGTNLLTGLLPLVLGLITWVLMIVWLRYANRSHT